jgi:hypothetical protein
VRSPRTRPCRRAQSRRRSGQSPGRGHTRRGVDMFRRGWLTKGQQVDDRAGHGKRLSCTPLRQQIPNVWPEVANPARRSRLPTGATARRGFSQAPKARREVSAAASFSWCELSSRARRSSDLVIGTTAGREIRGSHSALNPCPRLVPATTRSQRPGLWIILPLAGSASAQKCLAPPTKSISPHPISAGRPSDHR